jgi:hypothetical protein
MSQGQRAHRPGGVGTKRRSDVVRTKIHDHRQSMKEIDIAQGRSMVLEHVRDQRLDNSGGT